MIPKNELEKLRAATPGTRNYVHLNNAGAALMPDCVNEAVQSHLTLEAEMGGYEATVRERERCLKVYDLVAKMLGADASEIALIENATLAWQAAFHSVSLEAGNVILTSDAEYGANYVSYLQKAKNIGVEIITAPLAASGEIDLEAMAALVGDATMAGRIKLIAITHIPTNGGLVNPAVGVGEIARNHGITYLLDACQSVGQMPLDVNEIGCDFLSATGRKFLRGPRGTGFLYVRREMLAKSEPAMIDHFGAEWTQKDRYQLRDNARRYETWENAYALHLGLGAAVELALDVGLDRIQNHSWSLAQKLRDGLAAISGMHVTDIGAVQGAIVSCYHDEKPADVLKQALAERGIHGSVSQPSSTLLDTENRALPNLLRLSPHYYNTEGEIELCLTVLEEICRTC